MRTASTTALLVLLSAVIMLLAEPVSCVAAEKSASGVKAAEKAEQRQRWAKLPAEAVERIMKELKETNPEKAGRLEQLRESDPAGFKDEMRKIMRQRHGKGLEEWKDRAAERSAHPPAGPERHFREPGHERGGAPEGAELQERRGRRERRERFGEMRQRHSEFIKWLEATYPEDANDLAELKEKNPEVYMRHLGLSLRRYGRIFEASKDNPRLAEVLKEDRKLKRQRDKLHKRVKATEDEAEKKALTAELEEIISRRFDLIVVRKQIEYEQLREKLEELKKQLKESEAEVEKWKVDKDKRVKERLERLLSNGRRFRWN